MIKKIGYGLLAIIVVAGFFGILWAAAIVATAIGIGIVVCVVLVVAYVAIKEIFTGDY